MTVFQNVKEKKTYLLLQKVFIVILKVNLNLKEIFIPVILQKSVLGLLWKNNNK